MTFEASAVSFDNPDFVDVVIQSYRHRYGYVPGDPALLGVEADLAKQPTIAVPTINLYGGNDGVTGAGNEHPGTAFHRPLRVGASSPGWPTTCRRKRWLKTVAAIRALAAWPLP